MIKIFPRAHDWDTHLTTIATVPASPKIARGQKNHYGFKKLRTIHRKRYPRFQATTGIK
jgi:hypothetical protein